MLVVKIILNIHNFSGDYRKYFIIVLVATTINISLSCWL